MHQAIALEVKVQAFRCNIAGYQQSHRRIPQAERLLGIIEFVVAHVAGHGLNLVLPQVQVLLQAFLEPPERRDALGEDHQPVAAVRGRSTPVRAGMSTAVGSG